MQKDRLLSWANLLLDIGKKNALVSYKSDSPLSLKILSPSYEEAYRRILSSSKMEIFDPHIEEDEEYLYYLKGNKTKKIDEGEYLAHYSPKLKKSALLLYSATSFPMGALSNLFKKAYSALEETGVNILYLAFGLLEYKEKGSSSILTAPLVLLPVYIERESALKPYYISHLEEEGTSNPTLLYKLKEEYGLVIPEIGEEDIASYFAKVKEIIEPLGFSLKEESYLSIFSFQKMNMYRDLLDNKDIILENQNVLALLGEATLPPLPEKKEESIHNVVDADSSQIEAINLAKEGVSFVLQGPPGTGKSQTITNIIAESLYEGKKVLFVSEKLAALSVVYNKLKAAGLEEFSLELHSHKANKKAVIDELYRTLYLPKSHTTPLAEEEIKSKESSEKELNKYDEELHKVRGAVNRSLYEMLLETSNYLAYPDTDFVISNITKKDRIHVEKANELLARYAEYSKRLSQDYRLSPFYGLTYRDATYEGKKKLESNLKKGKECFSSLARYLEKLSSYGIKANSLSSFKEALPYIVFLSGAKFISPLLLDEKNYEGFVGDFAHLSNLRNKIRKLEKEIDKDYEKGVYDLIDKCRFIKKEYSLGLKRIFSRKYKDTIEEISSYKKDHKKASYKDIVFLSSLLESRKKLFDEFLLLEEEAHTYLSTNYTGITDDFSTIEKEVNELKNYLPYSPNAIRTMSKEEFSIAQEKLASLYKKYSSFLDKKSSLIETLSSYFLKKSLDIENDDPSSIANRCQNILDNYEDIEGELNYLVLLDDIKKEGLISYLDYSLDKGIDSKDFAPIYHKAFYYQYSDYVIASTKELSSLSRLSHDALVKKFIEKDKTSFLANKGLLKERLSALRPDVSLLSGGSQVSRLILEAQKKRRQMPIRTLFSNLEELVHALKPCILMSPLSVSTYLSPSFHFDLVIFDEASQIFPQDALGAIYRSKQVIIVGDSEQMPPTNFFATSIEEDEEEIEEGVNAKDYSSILDVATAVFPQKRLLWHYRSHYEELIAFSNKNFYASSLLTFPSSTLAISEDKGISYHYVKGIYDRSSRTNKIEAQEVISLIYDHIKTHPERSLGIVAFSLAQQSLIEYLLAKKRREDPQEEFFSLNKPEPFFIKNLETVQGDERDVIIFSTSYGPDITGKTLLNFGPLNKEGGERRLNVAITRAKMNVKLVTSLRHEDIDLNRTHSRGAALLKEYLEYAENGRLSFYSSAFETSPLEKEIGAFLTEQGYSYDFSLGSSSVPIDIAVKKDDNSYLLAIESDGPLYHSFQSARDRDRLREEKLESMGWHHYRVWSTDWYRNKNMEKKELLKAIEEAKVSNEETPTNESQPIENTEQAFIEIEEKKETSFPCYEMVDPHSIEGNVEDIAFAIIEKEAPIKLSWLLARIVYLYDRNRVTKVVERDFSLYVMPYLEMRGVRLENDYLFFGEEIPMLRLNKEGNEKREIPLIYKEELAKGMKAIIEENIVLSQEGLFTTMTKLLGFDRRGAQINNALEAALDSLYDEIEILGGMIHLKSSGEE